MNEEDFKLLIQDIVRGANELKNKHTDESDALVNYACIFSQSKEEFEEFLHLAHKIGKIIEQTATGPIFQIKPLDTVAGKLQLLKIRSLDKTRPERGDADFTVLDYLSFKKNYLHKKGFSLIEKKNFEMIELIDSNSKVRAYFSNPP